MMKKKNKGFIRADCGLIRCLAGQVSGRPGTTYTPGYKGDEAYTYPETFHDT